MRPRLQTQPCSCRDRLPALLLQSLPCAHDSLPQHCAARAAWLLQAAALERHAELTCCASQQSEACNVVDPSVCDEATRATISIPTPAMLQSLNTVLRLMER